MDVTRGIILSVLLGLAGLLPSALAQDAAGDAVQSATREAVANLIDDISRTPINRNFTIGDVLQRTGSCEELARALERAEQVGGPRWIDDRTCQIQLQISGLRVSSAIQRIAVANLRQLPVTLGELNRAMRDWEERSFTATGTSRQGRPAAVTVNVQPKVGVNVDQWPGIGKLQRDQTIGAAKLDAAQRSLRSVSAITLTPKSTVGDVMGVRDVGAGMVAWMIDQPAAVELHPDLEATVTLKVAPETAFETFKGLAARQKEVALPADEDEWAKAKAAWAQRMAAPVGKAMLMTEPREQGFTRRPLGMKSGRQQPEWIEKRIKASGDALRAPGTSKLQAARAAENAAEKKLMAVLLDLPYCGGKTIAETARDNDKIVEALRRALRHARIVRTDYKDDGSAMVEIYLDLADLWYELKSVE